MTATRASSIHPLSKAQRECGALSLVTLERGLKAVALYRSRQLRQAHPEGHFDKQRRFWPSKAEDCGVTKKVRAPSARWYLSYLIACRSFDHCCDLNKVKRDEALKVRRAIHHWQDIPWWEEGVVEEVLEGLKTYHTQYRLEQYRKRQKQNRRG